jgi:2-iminobutanoate/2-iminopropanoate deaminase
MAKRQSIMWPGFTHSNPIPNASKIGNIVMSSVIGPRDPATGKTPETLEEQVKNLFLQLSAAIKAAGGTPDDILKIEFWAKDQGNGKKCFPTPLLGRHGILRLCRRIAQRISSARSRR